MEMPAENGFVLYEHIDSTALDSLLAESAEASTVRVTFDLTAEHTYRVELCDDHLSVRRADTA